MCGTSELAWSWLGPGSDLAGWRDLSKTWRLGPVQMAFLVHTVVHVLCRLVDTNRGSPDPRQGTNEVEMVQITQVCTERGLGLHDNLVGLAEFIEVIDVQGAHLGLQGHKYLIERHPEVLRLNTVYIDKILRHIGAVELHRS